VRSGTIKKHESSVPETIKTRLKSYPGWSDLVRFRKNGATVIFCAVLVLRLRTHFMYV